MSPNFNQKTINILAKRASYRCSNPDCRVLTVGPNSDPNKSTTIGEAAHIYGARPGSKRYVARMTNDARADITNAIWLCRNCHKHIDSDDQEFSSGLLFVWREKHEEYVLSELGSKTDKIKYEQQNLHLKLFKNYSPLIRRIVIDKPDGWEFRLTAELMRYLNSPFYRKIKDLKEELYVKPFEHVDDEKISEWIIRRLQDSSRMVKPMVGLIDKMNKSWGAPGDAGDEGEIHHVCCLIKDHLRQIVEYEEITYFTVVPEKYERIVELLKNHLGTQAEKLMVIPDRLDEIASFVDKNYEEQLAGIGKIDKTIVFELPISWEQEMNRELRKLNIDFQYDSGQNKLGCFPIIIIIIIASFIFYFFG